MKLLESFKDSADSAFYASGFSLWIASGFALAMTEQGESSLQDSAIASIVAIRAMFVIADLMKSSRGNPQRNVKKVS